MFKLLNQDPPALRDFEIHFKHGAQEIRKVNKSSPDLQRSVFKLPNQDPPVLRDFEIHFKHGAQEIRKVNKSSPDLQRSVFKLPNQDLLHSVILKYSLNTEYRPIGTSRWEIRRIN